MVVSQLAQINVRVVLEDALLHVLKLVHQIVVLLVNLIAPVLVHQIVVQGVSLLVPIPVPILAKMDALI